MNIQLSDNFTYIRLIRFTLPTIAGMVFTSIYGIVDGFFISNFAGTTDFAATNFILPYIMIFSSLGFIAGTGGSALVSKILGQGDSFRAKQVFSLIIYIMIGISLVLTVIAEVLLRPACIMLGGEGEMMELAIAYGRISLLTTMPYTLQYTFQSFMITAEKPRLGMYITIAAGVLNFLLDIVFVGILDLGVQGAAAATSAGEILGGILPLIYFVLPNKSLLRLTKPCREIRPIIRTFTNGASELMSSLSMSFMNAIYNFQLMYYMGSDGVAAYGVIMYAAWIFYSVFAGFAQGSAPVTAFKYGADDYKGLKNMLVRCGVIMAILSIGITIIAIVSARYMVSIFISQEPELVAITTRAFRIFILGMLFGAFNILGSSFFTALNNGIISGLIAFTRVMVFQLAFILILPRIMGVDGIWWSSLAGEIPAFLLTLFMLARYRKRYHYF